MKNSILLINSPLYRESTTLNEDYLPPLGLIYIATYLKERNVPVEILDSINSKLGVQNIIDYVKMKSPQYMGINIFTINYEFVKEICENVSKNTKVIVGGNLTKFSYKKISQWNCANLTVIVGDGEKIVYDIINSSIKEKPIYSYNNNNVYEVNLRSLYYESDINKLNLDRSFITVQNTNHFNDIEESIISSRGCVYNCAYCGSARSINRDISVRSRSIENLKEEIAQIINLNSMVRCIRVLDDLFLKNRNSIIDAIELFDSFGTITWRAMAHIGSFANSLDLLDNLFKSGCKELFIGIESGSPNIRSFIKKEGKIDDIIKVLSAILDSGISVKCYFIVGFPTEKMDDMDQTYKLAKQIRDYSLGKSAKFRASVFKFRPYHGTELYNYIMRDRKEDIVTTHDELLDSNRSQFNFTSGNYCEETDEIVNRYIRMIQSLNE